MKANKKTHTTVETIIFTREDMDAWANPPFQRPLRINDRVLSLAASIQEDGGVIPGILTLGRITGSPVTYLLDGQHRRAAAGQTSLDEFYSDVRTHIFPNMGAMGEEFVNLNSSLVRMRPDDILRGLEGSIPWLGTLRKQCPFVGYDMIRRGERSPIVSASLLLRAWDGSQSEIPGSHAAGASKLVHQMTPEEAATLTLFTKLMFDAWGREPQYSRLWASLNVTLCAWLYRRTVVRQYSLRTTRLTNEQFARCLTSLSANDKYLDWLVGRTLSDRSRAPAYGMIKSVFSQRYMVDTKSATKPPMFPAPEWAHGTVKRIGRQAA